MSEPLRGSKRAFWHGYLVGNVAAFVSTLLWTLVLHVLGVI